MDGAPGHDPLNHHGCGTEAVAAGETGEMGAAGAEDFSAEKVKLGNTAADDMDKGKENGQCWIKKKLNTALTHGVAMLMGVTNTKR